MTFITGAYVIAAFCFLFAILSLYASYKEEKIGRIILALIGVSFVFLSLFSVLVGLGFSIEYTNQATCENIINSTTLSGNTTTYTYIDSCASRATPESIERLYQAYAAVLLIIILVSTFGLMFLGMKRILFKW